MELNIRINFDMDGTIADLYGVDRWQEKLDSGDASPYTEAKVLHNMSLLARYLHKAQNLGIQVNIISWMAKDCSATYAERIIEAKEAWLRKHLPSVTFDNIYIIPFDTPKSEYVDTFANNILFDDNERVMEEWIAAGRGYAYPPALLFLALQEALR